MKKPINNTLFFFALLCVLVYLMGPVGLYAQKTKKNSTRLNIEYVKIMEGEIYFNVKSSARINKKNMPVSRIELSLFNVLDDEKITLGKVKTNHKGEGRLTLKGISSIKADSSNIYNIQLVFKGNDTLKQAKKNISFKDVYVNAKLIEKDSINFVEGTLIDSSTNEPITGEFLKVQVERLFLPLLIGDEFNETDDEGKILVPIEDGIPGVDGNLNIEVVLYESDDYGTVKAVVMGSIGVPITDESTFDQRTMWSPRGKTPLFLLFLTYSGILIVWGIITYLVVNLFKIVKY